MPYWGWILLIVGLSVIALAIFYASLHLAHRTIPARQAAQGDAEDISAPLPTHVTKAHDEPMTARELEEERQQQNLSHMAYEIVRGAAANAPAEVVGGLPQAELGQVLFYDGHFWRVDAIEPARSGKADARLIVSLTTNAAKPNPVHGREA